LVKHGSHRVLCSVLIGNDIDDLLPNMIEESAD
jgi:hypothetical protein